MSGDGSFDEKRALGLLEDLRRRYGSIPSELLELAILPLRMPISKITGTQFEISDLPKDTKLAPGRTGKIVSQQYVAGQSSWSEVLKGKLVEVTKNSLRGEFYHMRKDRLKKGLSLVKAGDYFEIDRFGITSKLESSLTEAAFIVVAENEGYAVTKMPENLSVELMPNMLSYLKSEGLMVSALEYLKKEERAKGWPHFDFLVRKDSRVYRVEVKSLWGTDTSKARLIHSLTEGWKTSSCRFRDQDIFAVNLWLRTGNVMDFAFAVSHIKDKGHDFGLPPATSKGESGKKVKLLSYVHQNPECEVGNGTWFDKLSNVTNLCDKL